MFYFLLFLLCTLFYFLSFSAFLSPLFLILSLPPLFPASISHHFSHALFFPHRFMPVFPSLSRLFPPSIFPCLSPRKEQGFKKERTMFGCEAIVDLSVSLETFSTVNIHHYITSSKLDIFPGLFVIF